MKTKLFAILAAVIFLSLWSVQAYAVWDIYSDTDIYSGSYPFINIYDTPPDHTTVNMYGGGSDYITTYDQSTLNFFGGYADVEARESSNINILGNLNGIVRSSDNSVINFSDEANSESLRLQNFGICTMMGGTTEDIRIADYSIIDWKGGDITDYISAYDSSTVNIYGYDLFKSPSGGAYGYGYVSGFLTYGGSFFVDLYNIDAYSHINLIPEPATLVLFGFGSLILLRKKYS